jgi:chaperonin GroES
MNIKPLGDRVIIRGIEEDNTTAGGIIIPGNSQAPTRGDVMAVGVKCEEVKVGDKVFFEDFATKEIDTGSEKFLIIKEEDITAIVE